MTDRPAAFAAAAGAAVWVVGVVALVGWAADVEMLRALATDSVAMNPLTALCFAGLGVALIRRARRGSSDAIVAALAAAAGIAALSRIVAYLGLPDAGLDRHLFADALAAYDPPNRMAPNTAAAMAACSLAMLLLPARRERALYAGQLAAVAAATAGLITVTGYAFGLADLMGLRAYIAMALPTGACFMTVGAGILALRTDAGFVRIATANTRGGRLFRRTGSAAFLLPPVLGWIGVHAVDAGLLTRQLAISVAAIVGTLLLIALIGRSARALDRADEAHGEVDRMTHALVRDLQRKSAELAAANEELEAFSYSVSHDLRAPLRSISGFSQILIEDHAPSLDTEARSYLDRIVRASARMAQLIDDLLELSRSARGELSRGEVDVSAIAHEIVEEMQLAEPQRDVEIAVQPALEVWADARLVRVVLTNLVHNAWKYTATTVAPRIEIGALPRAGTGGVSPLAAPGGDDQGSVAVVGYGPIVFYVRDNGVGFDMAYADRLFTPFQRMHRRDEFEGSGVGLATVRRIVHRHGGRVWAQAAPGTGATFYFTLNPPIDR